MGGWKEFSLFHVLMFITFLASGLLVNLVQLVVWVVLVRILGDRRLFRRFNYYCIYLIYGQLLFLADWWSGSEVRIFSAMAREVQGRESALIIMNHHYELDWLYGWMVGDRASILGNCRVYVKKAIQWVPVIGWAWNFSDTLFLARDWSRDQTIIDKVLVDLQDYPSPVWILLFPEGTRYTKDKYEASKTFAESRGLPVLKHHLVPRTKGFTYTLSRLDKEKISCIYDVTLGCDTEVRPTLTNVLLGRKTRANMFIRRIDIRDVPEEETAAAQWLSDLYTEKDEILDTFHRTGSFPTELAGETVPARPWTLLISLALNLSTLAAILLAMTSAGTLGLLGGGLVLVLASFGIKYFINITKISKSSSYGGGGDKKKE